MGYPLGLKNEDYLLEYEKTWWKIKEAGFFSFFLFFFFSFFFFLFSFFLFFEKETGFFIN